MGRVRELEVLDLFLSEAAAKASVLVLAGEAGIGKTTLWRHGMRCARLAGVTVMECRPVEAETGYALSGLADLFDGVVDQVLDDLPGPQRRALGVAFLHREDEGAADPAPDHRALDHRTLGAATLSALRAVARTGPVILGIDDVQWLDEASAQILSYVVRRLRTEPVGLLTAQRCTTTRLPLGLRDGDTTPGVRHVRLDRLDLPALHRILQDQLGVAVARPTLLRIDEASGGNPFYALEIARHLLDQYGPATQGWLPPDRPTSIPDSLQELAVERVRMLPEAVRDALLHVAITARPAVGTIRLALGAERGGLSALTPAEESGLVTIDQEEIRFTHPLFATAVQASASAERRQRAHCRMASVVTDPEQRARHWALASDAPNADMAALLELAASSARSRGAPGAAAELLQLAGRRTPADDCRGRQRRAVAEAECLFAAGAAAQARALLAETTQRMPPGEPRARALLKLAEIVFYAGGTVEASDLCQRALADAPHTVELRAELYLRRAWFSTHDSPTQLASAEAAVELLERSVDFGPDPTLRACAYAVAAMYRLTSGNGIEAEYLARARALLPPTPSRGWAATSARQSLGAWAKCFDPVEARRWFCEEHRLALEFGDEPAVGHALMHLSEIDCWLGDWARARDEAIGSVQAIKLTGQSRWVGFALYAKALVEAHQGSAEAERTAAEGLALAEASGDPYVGALIHQVLGFLGISSGDLDSAGHHLERAATLVDSMKIRDPARYLFHGDQIEVAAGLCGVAEARRLLARFQRRLEVAPRPWLVAVATRCEAVVLAAEGRLEEADRSARIAVDLCAALPVPLESGRCLLVRGRILRALKRKRSAREVLQRSVAVFEALGAPLWAAQARADLERCGLRRAGDALSPTEEKVAALVAEGMTNQEIAARLYITAKTVEANLTRVYRKLAVANRRELARWVRGR